MESDNADEDNFVFDVSCNLSGPASLIWHDGV